MTIGGRPTPTPLRPDPPIFAEWAGAYLASGLGFPIPLPPRMKSSPPKGFTGIYGAEVTEAQLKKWIKSRRPHCNIGLRVDKGVLGLDVDAYPPKQGGLTLARLEELLGPLPVTPTSTNRDDGISGIRFFRAPEEHWTPTVRAVQADGSRTAHIDVIQYRHRYATSPPSRHYQGRTYRWQDAAGFTMDGIPTIGDLAELPERWIDYLRVPPDTFSKKVREANRNAPPPVGPSVHTTAGARLVERACAQVATARDGERNDVLNRQAFLLGMACLRGAVAAKPAKAALEKAAVRAGLDEHEASKTVASGWAAGVRYEASR